ncbi:MAG: hypothetical protein ACPKQO_04575, partial [Nitrososphaeraceae archaeon]
MFFILIGFLSFDYEFFQFEKPLISLPYDAKIYFDLLPWILFIILVVDLYLKYLIVNKNRNKFIKKYWLDLILTLLIPVLFPFKLAKVSFKSYKLIKTTKYSFKIFQKIKKFKFK